MGPQGPVRVHPGPSGPVPGRDLAFLAGPRLPSEKSGPRSGPRLPSEKPAAAAKASAAAMLAAEAAAEAAEAAARTLLVV